MSGTAEIKLVILLDHELRALARAYANILKLTKDSPEESTEKALDAVLHVGHCALKHLIYDPDAAFVILGSGPRRPEKHGKTLED